MATATNGVFDLLCDAVFQHWLLAADLLQRQLAAFVIEFLETVEAVAVRSSCGVLQSAEAGRFATPTAPRPASAYDLPWGPAHHMSD